MQCKWVWIKWMIFILSVFMILHFWRAFFIANLAFSSKCQKITIITKYFCNRGLFYFTSQNMIGFHTGETPDGKRQGGYHLAAMIFIYFLNDFKTYLGFMVTKWPVLPPPTVIFLWGLTFILPLKIWRFCEVKKN